MRKDPLLLSVIIPCYNESENLRQGVLDEVFNYLANQKFNWELIISDDGSTDDSRGIITEFIRDKQRVSLLKNDHGGKPAAVFQGIKAAAGEYILFTDMDQSTPISELAKILPYLAQYPVIIGSRIERKKFPLYRRIGSRVFRILRQAILLRDIHDTQCGFKIFKTSLARQIFPQLEFFRRPAAVSGWKVTSFDVELLHLTELRKEKIKEILVEWEDRDLATGKDKNYFKESWAMLVEIFRIKWNDLRGVYRNLKK